jgi:hypothetical protein
MGIKLDEIGNGSIVGYLKEPLRFNRSEMNAGFSDTNPFTTEELLKIATLSDHLLGKLLGFASRGGDIGSHLAKHSKDVVNVRIGSVLLGVLPEKANAIESTVLETYEEWTGAVEDFIEDFPLASVIPITMAGAGYGAYAGVASSTPTGGVIAPATTTAGGAIGATTAFVGAGALALTNEAIQYLEAYDTLDSSNIDKLSFQDEKRLALAAGITSFDHLRAMQAYDIDSGLSEEWLKSSVNSLNAFLQGSVD